MIKAVIFDFFGVVFGHGTWGLYEIAGGDPIKDAEFLEEVTQLASRGKITTEEFHKRIAKNLDVPLDEWKKLNFDTEVANDELLQYIIELKTKYKVALLSNAARGGVYKRLTEEQQDIFDEIIVSAEVGFAKPDVEIFKLTADRLGVKPEECVFADDHAKYLKGAREAGLRTIQFENTEQFKQDLERILND